MSRCPALRTPAVGWGLRPPSSTPGTCSASRLRPPEPVSRPRSGLQTPSNFRGAFPTTTPSGFKTPAPRMGQVAATPASRIIPRMQYTPSQVTPGARLQPPRVQATPSQFTPASRLQPPRIQPQGLVTPASRLQPPRMQQASVTSKPRPPAKTLSRPQIPATGKYFMPAQYGPQTLKGKGLVYSSPAELRRQIEQKLPKALKYFKSEVPIGQGKDRAILAQVPHFGDTQAGQFEIYQTQPMSEEAYQREMDLSALNRVVFDPIDLQMLVEEEIHDIENTLQLLPSLNILPVSSDPSLQLKAGASLMFENIIGTPWITADEPQQPGGPEVVASIMHNVENSIKTQSTTQQVCSSLFEQTPNNQLISMHPVVPGKLQDAVVPSGPISAEIHNELQSEDFMNLSARFETISQSPGMPEYLNVFSRFMPEEVEKYKEKRRKKNLISEELPPWGDDLFDLVGADPIEEVGVLNISQMDGSGKLDEELARGIEYFVNADPSQYGSKVQLRGSVAPSWFPGYLMALPEYHDTVKVEPSPDRVFYNAWKAVQPTFIPEESFMIV